MSSEQQPSTRQRDKSVERATSTSSGYEKEGKEDSEIGLLILEIPLLSYTTL